MSAKLAICGALLLSVAGLIALSAWAERERAYQERLAAYHDLWRGSSLVRVCGKTHIYRLRDGRHVTAWPPESGTPVDINTIC
jgi:hypothetical protein